MTPDLEKLDGTLGTESDLTMRADAPVIRLQTNLQEGYNLAPGDYVVGREGSIKIPYGDVSRRHCTLSVHADGSVSISDAGSRNGTSVNGNALKPGEIKCVGAGATIGLGDLHILTLVQPS
ncbi:MAG: FHA domain-containing protein [Candidatus Andersenbacteria bacterium]|nr:FHA domain-containing protein [Candidatus Andersenbacteria bacterium]MBI3250938.1 FHA domain-containing protein [Candidatus Andersenbacteria bacterium]